MVRGDEACNEFATEDAESGRFLSPLTEQCQQSKALQVQECHPSVELGPLLP
jgi:hypothetical protein